MQILDIWYAYRQFACPAFRYLSNPVFRTVYCESIRPATKDDELVLSLHRSVDPVAEFTYMPYHFPALMNSLFLYLTGST